MTDMNKEFERYDLNMIASNAKESYDKLKELNRAVVKKEDILRLAIQDRILGVIDDKELERITREAKLANDASYDEKCKLRRLITRLRDIVDELNHDSTDCICRFGNYIFSTILENRRWFLGSRSIHRLPLCRLLVCRMPHYVGR